MKTAKITEVTFYDAGKCPACGYRLGVWESYKKALASRRRHKSDCLENPNRRDCSTCAHYNGGYPRPCLLVTNLLGNGHRLLLANPVKGVYSCKSYQFKAKDGE